MWLWFVPFIIIFVIILATYREHEVLAELKARYRVILDVLKRSGDKTWDGVLRPAIITGMTGWDKSKGPIGSNINKGYEIYICLDGNDVNSAMYVLIHELAHMSVPEYDHTSAYWDNFKKLKDICVQNGLYKVEGERGYCGDTIKDH